MKTYMIWPISVNVIFSLELRRKSNRFAQSSIRPAVADAKKKRLKSLLTKRLYVEESDVKTEEVVLFSSSISNMSSGTYALMFLFWFT